MARRPITATVLKSLTVAALAGAPFVLLAEETPPSEEASTGPLAEIVVTATRKEESLSRVPISVTALTEEMLDVRGIKDFQDVARFTPGIRIDNSGTNNISIRGIASTGGAGTTGIYLDDTPIQMRALGFSPDEALPKSFDIERVEVLRGPQGTLFGAGSEGGTVRYITVQPSLTRTSFYSREEVSYTQGGAPSYEAGVAGGTPLIDGTLGIRVAAWYRYDGGWIDRIDPYTQALDQHNANYGQTKLLRLSAVWAPSDKWTVTPSFFYQDRYRNDVDTYWGLYSNPSSDRFVDANPTQHRIPDIFYLPALKLEGDLGSVKLTWNSSYYHRAESTGYDGTLYNLGFYQAQGGAPVIPLYNSGANPDGSYSLSGNWLPGTFPLVDGTGLHVPFAYRSPATVDNGQENWTHEVRLQSNDPSSALTWTTGLFLSLNKQSYLEQIHDPQLNQLSLAVTGQPYTSFFSCVPPATGPAAPGCTDPAGTPVTYDPRFPNDSYFLENHAEDKQLAWFGEGTYSFTDQFKTTLGLRASRTEFSFNTLTGGPQLFLPPQTKSGDKKENSFTPKLSLQYQYDPHDLYYFTYAKGFRPPGANNPVPAAACGTDFQNFGIKAAPDTYNSDTVDSFEIGAKNNLDNRVKIASSLYYIRWNNIQQTVVPPICQISFVSNLGNAIAKGIDLQAEIAVTDALGVELAAGYTDARYTSDSKLSPTGAAISLSGDAISGQSGSGLSGQPAAPYTLTVGVEYKFDAWSHESFVRVDDEYSARSKWASPSQDPNTQQYDFANYVLSSTQFASIRGGTNFGNLQVAAFIDNLTDTHTVTNYEWSIDPGTNPNTGAALASRLQRNYTFRPRTFGLTFTYRSH